MAKIILFFVEGRSDWQLLGKAIDLSLPPEYGSSVCIFEGDMTADRHISPKNAESRIGEWCVKPAMDQDHIDIHDIAEIVQITDLDGSFIDDLSVYQSAEHERPFYGEYAIQISDTQKIIMRNRQKREILEVLSGLTHISYKRTPIPYSIYYFSCNLDHFFHGQANLPDREKMRKARKASADTEHVMQKILSNGCKAQGLDYAASWRILSEKRDFRSLEAGTNFDLFLNRFGIGSSDI